MIYKYWKYTVEFPDDFKILDAVHNTGTHWMTIASYRLSTDDGQIYNKNGLLNKSAGYLGKRGGPYFTLKMKTLDQLTKDKVTGS